jgi:hypothetical protein
MIGYVTIGTNRIEEAGRFYDELLATIGAGRAFDTDTFIAWASGPGSPALSISKPFDGAEATVGNGVMVAIAMDSKEKLNAFHFIPN